MLKLDLSRNLIYLKMNSKLKSLDIRGQHIGDEGFVMLSRVLQSPSCRLQRLFLEDNSFSL